MSCGTVLASFIHMMRPQAGHLQDKFKETSAYHRLAKLLACTHGALGLFLQQNSGNILGTNQHNREAAASCVKALVLMRSTVRPSLCIRQSQRQSLMDGRRSVVSALCISRPPANTQLQKCVAQCCGLRHRLFHGKPRKARA